MSDLVKLTPSNINCVFVYTRVSTGKQSTYEKYSLDTQRYLCDKYINQFYPSINASYYKDIGSSYNTNMILHDMSAMIYKLKPNTLIIISEISRLGRSSKMVEKILEIVKKKKSLIYSISENLIYGKTKLSNDKFIKKVMESEKESDILSMRVKNIQKYIKQNGGYVGKPPFGYKVVKNSRNIPVLKENEEHFKLIDNIVNFADECYTYDEIKDKMNSKNLLLNGKLWTSTKIKSILNKFYPEHMLLDINDKIKKSNIVIVDDDIDNHSELNESGLYKRIKNTKYEQLKITISNNYRSVSHSPTSSIKLRSGREILKF